VLFALEINNAKELFVPPANAARGDAAVKIASARLLANLDQAPLRPVFGDLSERRDGDVARRRSQRSKRFYWHKQKAKAAR
jgi:hypothetical protein